MTVLRWVALFVFLAIMAAFFEGHRSWELLVAAIAAAAVVFYTCGGFSRAAWFGTPEFDAECARVDAELDAVDSRHP